MCIAAEAMKYDGEVLAVHLTLLFNMFVSHCYMPQDLIITTIVPLLKIRPAMRVTSTTIVPLHSLIA